MSSLKCRACGGSRRIAFRHPTRAAIVSHECTSCNGTGIQGDPRWLMGFMLFQTLLILAVGIYAVATYGPAIL